MPRFKVHDARSAPTRGARAALREVQRQRGHVPQLHGLLAQSEAALRGYMELGSQLSKASLTALERQVVMLQANHFRQAPYCMAGHSAIAEALGMPLSWIEALREGQPVPDARTEALRQFTLGLLEERGDVSDAQWAAFNAAGYGTEQALEVILALSLKTLSNFASRMAALGPDTGLQPMAWQAPEGEAHGPA